ncbi:MAG: PGPGW domain-containing protein [Pirellulaceae bacterium]
MDKLFSWLEEHETLLWSLTAIGVFMFLATLIAIPWLLTRLPADYFIRRPVRDWPGRHPAVHLGLVIVKNLLGVILVLAGIAMLVLPGQGLLTILVGIMFLDFPGKRRMERWLIRRGPILSAANWIRARAGKSPLEVYKTAEKSSAER